MTELVTESAVPAPSAVAELEDGLERYRVELRGYCYRMLGSSFEAEDAVQEALVRAWRAADRFDGRSSLRSWLYRIATNVCIDMLNGRKRRAMPMDFGSPSAPVIESLGEALPGSAWLEPVPDGQVLPGGNDPAEAAVAKESIRLAFVAALQHLPPRQRAVLILREVLAWKAAEVAELLDSSVASVNSALQRARATLAAGELDALPTAAVEMDAAHTDLLARYLDAFERYDIESLVTLLHDDAVQSMPPFALWLRGPADIAAWMRGPGAACEGSRLVPVEANGAPAFGQYRPSGPGGRHEPWALQVLRVEQGLITGMTFFLDTERMFPMFGLPATLQ
jgi:RNA polymerase sigma-70 factor (ECF subfamily)